MRRTAIAVLTAGLMAASAVASVTTSAGAQPRDSASPSDSSNDSKDDSGSEKSRGSGKGRGSEKSHGSGKLAAKHSLRAPVTNENFYFVMADRFANGDSTNDTGGISGDINDHGFDPTQKGYYNGGDLTGLLDRIDYIQGMGTTSIWLTPSFKNKAVQLEDGPSAGYHGYWVTDFTQIDPHLGTNAELKQLVDAAHSRGMKVYFDIITNHTADVIGYEEGARTAYIPKDAPGGAYKTASGREFDDRDYAGTNDFPALDPKTSFPYTPVLEPGEENLKVPAWLNDTTLYHNRGNTTFTGEDSYYGDFVGLDDLFTEHPTVVNGMIDIYETWIGEMGIDGFRIDTMKHVNDAFWQKFGPEVLAYAKAQGKKEFFMFGEVYDLTRPFTSSFTTRDRMQAVLDFPFQDAARNFASKSEPASELETFFANDDWYTDADSNVYQLPTFLGNHDMGRIGYFVTSDNDGASQSELLARDELAHELMYFSRGNPVVYYGDEQGFTGTGGDQLARQTMFASQVPDYLDDNLLGTDRTHAVDNFNPSHPLYKTIGELSTLTKQHPALRNGAHQHRYASSDAGIYAFSRIDHDEQHEYVVALNNSEAAKSAAVPTYVRQGTFTQVYGSGDTRLTTDRSSRLHVEVAPLSAVVYESVRQIPRSDKAPSIRVGDPAPSTETNSRMKVQAEVSGSSFNEVTFYAKVGNAPWTSIGTDDTRPYRVYHDTAAINDGTKISYRAVVRDNAGHTRTSNNQRATVPAPTLTIDSPVEGAQVFGTIQVEATADPEMSSHVVQIQRQVGSGDWETLTTDDSSPVYSYFDDVNDIAVGAEIHYRAILTEPDGTRVVSSVRTVTRTEPQPLVPSVTVAGSVQSEIGCPTDWDPACDVSDLAFDTSDGLWKGTWMIPEGEYEWKVAVDNSWDVNYGAGGASGGDNIALSVPAGGANVTFVWDQVSHVPSATIG
jgi:alpha-amylase